MHVDGGIASGLHARAVRNGSCAVLTSQRCASLNPHQQAARRLAECEPEGERTHPVQELDPQVEGWLLSFKGEPL